MRSVKLHRLFSRLLSIYIIECCRSAFRLSVQWTLIRSFIWVNLNRFFFSTSLSLQQLHHYQLSQLHTSSTHGRARWGKSRMVLPFIWIERLKKTHFCLNFIHQVWRSKSKNWALRVALCGLCQSPCCKVLEKNHKLLNFWKPWTLPWTILLIKWTFPTLVQAALQFGNV